MSSFSKDVIEFWTNEVGPQKWYDRNDTSTAKDMKSKFEPLWVDAKAGNLNSWMCTAEGCLALVLLLDQFPRIMFQGTAKAYQSDGNALAVAKRGLVMGHDLATPEHLRQFFYMPMMHSESLMDQERCVRLMSLRMPQLGETGILHAKAHRDVIRQFGRFPYRNEILERATTGPETAYMTAGGYDFTINTIAA